MNSTTIPSHVPANLVKPYNFFDMSGESDIYEHFRRLHDGPDIFYSPELGGHWVTTRFEDMEAILLNAEAFSSKHQTIPANPIVITMLEYDGDMHRDFRRLIMGHFLPKNIKALEEVARKLSIELIGSFIDKGECDFVAEFSLKMPIMILMNLLGLDPDDTPYLIEISEDIVRSGDPQTQMLAFQRVGEYIATKVIPQRRANPGDDIFSTVIKGSVEGRPVTDEELIGLGSLLIAAGLDTVVSMLGFIALFLAQNPKHRQQLADDPALINNALEELMRRHHIANIARVVANDIEYKGVSMKKGDLVLIPLSAAGVDGNRYIDPLTVNFNRKEKKPSLVFGRGPHMCIGAFLARTEMRVFLEEWMSRIPDFKIKNGEKPIIVPGKANSVRYLPLVWNV